MHGNALHVILKKIKKYILPLIYPLFCQYINNKQQFLSPQMLVINTKVAFFPNITDSFRPQIKEKAESVKIYIIHREQDGCKTVVLNMQSGEQYYVNKVLYRILACIKV